MFTSQTQQSLVARFVQWGLVAASCFTLAFGLAARAQAAPFSWDVAIDGGSWSNLRWNGGVTGPTTAGNTATISNNVPGTWSNGNQTITVDVPVTIDTLTINDFVPLSAVTLQVNQDLNVTTFNSLQDGSTRNIISIAAGRTLTVNNLNFTGTFHFSVGGAGTIKWNPIGGIAQFGYHGLDSDRMNVKLDFTDANLAEMKFVNNGSGFTMQGRDTSWTVGRTTGDQEFTVTGGVSPLILDQRSVGGGFDLFKVGIDDVDMGRRTGGNPSNGFRIAHALNGDFGGSQKRNVFTDAAGNATLGGTVRIADYDWIENATAAANSLMWAKVGSDLFITDGGKLRLRGRNTATLDDVSMFWVMPTKTLTIEGPAGNLEIDDAPTSNGRRGVYFENATISVGGDLLLTGAKSFLNGGAAGGTIAVAGDVLVQSQNPAGFATINGLAGGHTAASDNFDLRSSTLEFNGGGASTLDWDVNSPAKGLKPTLTLADFNLGNFPIGTLSVTNNTDVVLTTDQVLYLRDLVIDAGSTLTIDGDSELHFLDPDLSEMSRIAGYLGSRLMTPGFSITVTDGIGFSISFAVPEPSTVVLFGLGSLGLLFAGRRRK